MQNTLTETVEVRVISDTKPVREHAGKNIGREQQQQRPAEITATITNRRKIDG